MKCVIGHIIKDKGPYFSSGPHMAYAYCTTHNGELINGTDKCILGMVEEKVEALEARIVELEKWSLKPK